MKIGLSWVDKDAIYDETVECDSVEKLRLLASMFNGVDIDIASDRGQLAVAVLQNRLEKAPLAMLIDEIQTTDEYAQQYKHHPTYKSMYELLLYVYQMCNGSIIASRQIIATRIGQLLAPCHVCDGMGYKPDESIVSIIPCTHCNNGVQKDFYTGNSVLDTDGYVVL